MPDLNAAQVARAVTLIETGNTYKHMAQTLQVSKSVVHRVVKRYRQTGRYTRLAGQGRKRKTVARDDRFLVNRVLRNRTLTSSEVRTELQEVRGVTVSTKTVRRRLKSAGIKSHVPARGPLLTTCHRVARLNFARNHENWNDEAWSQVLFTDESRFCLKSDDGRVKVWRRSGERYAQCNIIGKEAYGGGSVMVWGGISMGARTELQVIENGSLTAVRYVTEILEQVVVPFAPFIGDGFVFMHDNARPHTAAVVVENLRDLEINTMGWPARSPDLNPIEHVWDKLGKQIKKRIPVPANLRDLKNALQEEWTAIPQDFIANLIRSMPRRLEAVRRARGGHTKYRLEPTL